MKIPSRVSVRKRADLELLSPLSSPHPLPPPPPLSELVDRREHRGGSDTSCLVPPLKARLVRARSYRTIQYLADTSPKPALIAITSI
jgi:hypothetical protein